MGVTRNPVRKMYDPCKICPDNIDTYGTCKRGYENFYCRRTKQSICPLVLGQRKSREEGRQL